MMENAVVPNDKILHTIDLIGRKVKPMLGL
jgi:hypothetical protein